MKLKILATTAVLFALSVAVPVKAANTTNSTGLLISSECRGCASIASTAIARREEEKNFDAINRIYRALLDREADYPGLRTWSRQLEKGVSLNDIREEIARSPEAEDKIKKIYGDVLGRSADLNGLRTWTDSLAEGSSLRDVRKQIANSREAEDAINRLYQQVLRRNADRDGMRTWKRKLADGMSLRELRREIASSPEARTRRR